MREPALEPARHPGATLTSVDGRTYPLESARIAARAEGGVAESRSSSASPTRTTSRSRWSTRCRCRPTGRCWATPSAWARRSSAARSAAREGRGRSTRKRSTRASTAGLLEQDRADTFRSGSATCRRAPRPRSRSGPAPAGLPAAARPGAPPEWEYRFPTVVGVRYQGDPGRVADAERLDVDRDAGGTSPPASSSSWPSPAGRAARRASTRRPRPARRDGGRHGHGGPHARRAARPRLRRALGRAATARGRRAADRRRRAAGRRRLLRARHRHAAGRRRPSRTPATSPC